MSELDKLKEQADELGIEYSPRIGVEKLREKIQENTGEGKEEAPKLSEDEQRKQDIIDKRKEATRLVRVIITPNQPEKRSLNGEIFSVSNDIISLKKYVPFGNENGWHIPVANYKLLKEKKFQTFRDIKVGGHEQKKGALVPAYNVYELDPLTEKEIADLAKAQRARQSIKD